VLVVVFCLAFWEESRQSKEEQQRLTPARLIVSRAGQKNNFPTIREAVARARPFDHIVLADAAIVEKLILNEVRNLTIEAAPGVAVVWSGPEHGSYSNELLYLNQCEGLQIQGIAFDGRDQVDEIVQLFGNCPGLSLKNLELRGFKKYGILLANCAGKSGKQVSIENVRITTAKDADAALAFVAHPNVVTPKLNEYIVVRDCRFEGDYAKPVMGDANALARERVDWKKNTYKSKKDSSPKPLPLP